MNYGTIKPYDIADGTGVRVSLFVSGCRRGCKNCFNPETWDFSYGQPFTQDTVDELIRLLAPPYIQGLTLIGGEPMEPENQRVLYPFVQTVRETYGDQKDIWCYTGCVLEKELLQPSPYSCEVTIPLLKEIDVLVDGPFVESLKDISLEFRGSSNQRILHLKDLPYFS